MLQVHKAKLRKQRISKRQRRQAQAEAGRRHMVLPREDLTSIARKHDVLVADIERLNPGTLPANMMCWLLTLKGSFQVHYVTPLPSKL